MYKAKSKTSNTGLFYKAQGIGGKSNVEITLHFKGLMIIKWKHRPNILKLDLPSELDEESPSSASPSCN